MQGVKSGPSRWRVLITLTRVLDQTKEVSTSLTRPGTRHFGVGSLTRLLTVGMILSHQIEGLGFLPPPLIWWRNTFGICPKLAPWKNLGCCHYCNYSFGGRGDCWWLQFEDFKADLMTSLPALTTIAVQTHLTSPMFAFCVDLLFPVCEYTKSPSRFLL